MAPSHGAVEVMDKTVAGPLPKDIAFVNPGGTPESFIRSNQ